MDNAEGGGESCVSADTDPKDAAVTHRCGHLLPLSVSFLHTFSSVGFCARTLVTGTQAGQTTLLYEPYHLTLVSSMGWARELYKVNLNCGVLLHPGENRHGFRRI